MNHHNWVGALGMSARSFAAGTFSKTYALTSETAALAGTQPELWDFSCFDVGWA